MPRQTRPWFRLYSEALDNPKLQRLDGDLFKLYINLLCVASQADQRGQLPRPHHISFRLRVDLNPLLDQLKELHRRKLLDGPWTAYRIHDWAEWQFESDVSTPRVKRFRERHGNVSETVQSRSRSETDQDTEAEAEAEPDPVLALPKFTERTWGRVLTGVEAKALYEHADDYGDECVRHCVEEAALSHVLTVKYVEGICKRHKKDGCYEQRGSGRSNGTNAAGGAATEPGDPLGILKPVTFIENPYGERNAPGGDEGKGKGGKH